MQNAGTSYEVTSLFLITSVLLRTLIADTRKMAMTLMAFSSIVLILAAAAFSPTQSEIFTALTHMAGFVRLEQILSPTLEEYLKYESAASADVKRFVNDVKRHVHDVTEEEMEHFVGHPVNSYLLLRRFVKGWRDILSKVDERSPQGKGNSKFATNKKYTKTRTFKDALLPSSAFITFYYEDDQS